MTQWVQLTSPAQQELLDPTPCCGQQSDWTAFCGSIGGPKTVEIRKGLPRKANLCPIYISNQSGSWHRKRLRPRRKPDPGPIWASWPTTGPRSPLPPRSPLRPSPAPLPPTPALHTRQSLSLVLSFAEEVGQQGRYGGCWLLGRPEKAGLWASRGHELHRNAGALAGAPGGVGWGGGGGGVGGGSVVGGCPASFLFLFGLRLAPPHSHSHSINTND
jgi:hypothetical protein